MDFKKSSFSEQLTHSSTRHKRRVVSGFAIGLLAAFIAFFFLNFSSNVTLLNPVLLGFNNLGSLNNSTNFISWSFSFSSTSCFSSHCCDNVRSVDVESSENVDHMVLRERHEANVSKNGGDCNFSDSSRKEGYHSGNSSEVGKYGNFSHQESWEPPFSKNLENTSFTAEKNLSLDKVIKDGGDWPNVAAKNFDDGNSTSNFSHADPPDQEVKLEKVNDRGNSYSISPKDSEVRREQEGFYGNCDIFHGRWVKDDIKPYYPPGSCPYIDRDFDCHLNKRPDDEYLRWKWQPYDCDIPSLNATDFLERLRGQKLVFVGDSLNRNMWESLACILRESIPDKKRVYEISGRREFKKRGSYAIKFEDYNCTVDFISSKFLVRESSFNGVNGSFDTLRLDLMDQTAGLYQDANVLVFNTGHWWTHEKTSRGENYYQEGDHVIPKLKVLEAFKRALVTWARWVDKNIDANKTKVIYRGYSMTHFRRGRWNSGGQCHAETQPIVNETQLANYPLKMRALENVIQAMKTPVIYLNISRLTDFRKDGHPSIYRREYKTVEEQNDAVSIQDCSHWCLPGVPDTWNELLYASLLEGSDQDSLTF